MLLRLGALPKSETNSVPPLYAGDQLSQPEFHRRYEQYTDDVKFELINGTVYMASPQRLPHGRYGNKLSGILYLYEMQTPGVEAADGSTVILGPKAEPQPDLFLRVLPELGGNTRTEDDYVYGGPELIIEIAHSTVAIDLHQKKDDYERCGVAEYVVVCVAERQVCWFDLAGGRTRKVPSDGILRSKAFAGLWIDTPALFRGDSKRMAQILNDGLASPEHARFLRRLAKAAERAAKSTKRPRKNGD
jgi:Uma2 family endonuclease